MSKPYCERDLGCRPGCHTEDCTRAMCLEEIQKPDYVPLHERISVLEAQRDKYQTFANHSLGVIARLEYKVKAQAELLERAKPFVEYAMENGWEYSADNWLVDLAKFQSEEAGEKT